MKNFMLILGAILMMVGIIVSLAAVNDLYVAGVLVIITIITFAAKIKEEEWMKNIMLWIHFSVYCIFLIVTLMHTMWIAVLLIAIMALLSGLTASKTEEVAIK